MTTQKTIDQLLSIHRDIEYEIIKTGSKDLEYINLKLGFMIDGMKDDTDPERHETEISCPPPKDEQ